MPAKRLRIGSVEARLDLNRLTRNGRQVPLEPKVSRLLEFLASRPRQVISREEILEAVWDGVSVSADALNRTVSQLRKALDDDPARPRYIQTVRGRGYRLIAAVEPCVAGPLRRHSKRRRLAAMLGAAAAVLMAAVAVRSSDYSSGLPAPGIAPARPMTSYPGEERQARFSPDGRTLAFCWNRGEGTGFDIYLKTMDSEEPLLLSSTPGVKTSPVWSPDASRIAFARRLNGRLEICLADRSDGSVRRIATLSGRRAPLLDWSPDGSLLAFSDRASPIGPQRLVLLHPKVGNRWPITDPPFGSMGDRDPVFSPDGKHLAFARYLSKRELEIRAFSIEDRSERLLGTGFANHRGLLWKSDSVVLAAADRGKGLSLWQLPLNGRPLRLRPLHESAFDFAAGRESGEFAFAQWSFDANIQSLDLDSDTELIEWDDASPAEPLAPSTRWDSKPSFSPDGESVAFISSRSGRMQIWLVRSDGSHPKRLTSLTSETPTSLSWHPDSKRLAAALQSENGSRLVSLDVEKGRLHPLTGGILKGEAPSWSRDGEILYFASQRSGDWQVWKLSLDEGVPRQVTYRGGYAAVEDPRGDRLLFTRKGQSGLWSMPLTGGSPVQLTRDLRSQDWANWTFAPSGILYVSSGDDGGRRLRLLDDRSGEVRDLAPADGTPYHGGLSVSPDGRRLLYVNVDRSESDLMLSSM